MLVEWLNIFTDGMYEVELQIWGAVMGIMAFVGLFLWVVNTARQPDDTGGQSSQTNGQVQGERPHE